MPDTVYTLFHLIKQPAWDTYVHVTRFIVAKKASFKKIDRVLRSQISV